MQKLSASLEDYLEIICNYAEAEKNIRAIDISKELKISRASATEALKKLASKGFINYGRYDVMLEPKNAEENDGIIIEFKVYDEEYGEKTLEDTIKSALIQIEEKKYAQTLTEHGVPEEKIRKYGFAFEGKRVLIG